MAITKIKAKQLDLVENKGDLVVGTIDSITDILSVGSEGQVLTVSSGSGVGLAWTTISGINTTTNTEANTPTAGSDGNLFFPNNSFYIKRDSGSVWANWGPIYPLTPPVLGDFTWVNQGGATAVTTNGGIFMSTPADGTAHFRILKKAKPTVPYTITVAILPLLPSLNYAQCGILFRQNSDGKLHVFRYVHDNSVSGFPLLSSSTGPDADTINANYNMITGGAGYETAVLGKNPLWLRIADNNTSRIVSVSNDGINFLAIHTVGRTDYLTADEVGFFVNSQNATAAAAMTLLSWKES